LNAQIRIKQAANNQKKEEGTAMKTTSRMHINRLNPLVAPVAKLAAALVALFVCANALPAFADRPPELPSPACDSLNVPDGKVSAHAYALGVQIYHWTGTNWLFIAPEAALFADQGFEGQIGIHYAGPTWEANDGSKVVGIRLAACTPNRGAIPCLKLGAISTSGPGRFERVTFIQRVNTIGGAAPAEAGLFVGDEARVPYTAEYYFYRAEK
jgi:hypothetical protein